MREREFVCCLREVKNFFFVVKCRSKVCVNDRVREREGVFCACVSGECDRKRQDVVRVGVRNDLRVHSTFRWDLQGRRQQQFLIISKCRMRNPKMINSILELTQ